MDERSGTATRGEPELGAGSAGNEAGRAPGGGETAPTGPPAAQTDAGGATGAGGAAEGIVYVLRNERMPDLVK